MNGESLYVDPSVSELVPDMIERSAHAGVGHAGGGQFRGGAEDDEIPEVESECATRRSFGFQHAIPSVLPDLGFRQVEQGRDLACAIHGYVCGLGRGGKSPRMTSGRC